MKNVRGESNPARKNYILWGWRYCQNVPVVTSRLLFEGGLTPKTNLMSPFIHLDLTDELNLNQLK